MPSSTVSLPEIISVRVFNYFLFLYTYNDHKPEPSEYIYWRFRCRYRPDSLNKGMLFANTICLKYSLFIRIPDSPESSSLNTSSRHAVNNFGDVVCPSRYGTSYSLNEVLWCPVLLLYTSSNNAVLVFSTPWCLNASTTAVVSTELNALFRNLHITRNGVCYISYTSPLFMARM